MRGRAGSSPDATPIAVIRQNPRGALCRASRKRDDVEQSSGDENESPSPGISASRFHCCRSLYWRPTEAGRGRPVLPETTPETGVISAFAVIAVVGLEPTPFGLREWGAINEVTARSAGSPIAAYAHPEFA